MIIRPLPDPLPGEHVLAVDPPLSLTVDAGWQVRPNLYDGRALGANAFDEDQTERSGRLALRGQMVAPGVVSGLRVRLDARDAGWIDVAPGIGVAASGEDVLLPRITRAPVASLTTFAARPSQDAGADPGYVEVASQPFSNAGDDRTSVAILVLQPVIVQAGQGEDPNDIAPIDPTAYSFVDEQLVDGCRLVLCTWPTSWLPLPSPSLPCWQSRLAAAIFARERSLPPGATMLWESVGVPIALVAFDASFNVLFVDCAAVARQGGGPRDRTPLLAGRGSPRLWQARLRQFSDQAAAIAPAAYLAGTASAQFRTLPPVGVLPKAAVDVTGWTSRFFPPNFTIEAVPVPFEQVDAAIADSAALDPFDMQAFERVRLLVPVPGVHYDPLLLNVVPTMDPAFEAAIDRSLSRLDALLGRRADLWAKLQALLDAAQGRKPQRFPAVDPQALAGEAATPVDPKQPEGAYDTATTTASSGLRVTLVDQLFETWPDGGWETLGGVVSGPPAVVSTGPGLLDVFVAGQGGTLMHQAYAAAAFGGWQALGGAPTPIVGAIAAVVDFGAAAPVVHLFARGQTPTTIVHKYAAATPTPPASTPPATTATAAAVPGTPAGPLTIGAWTEETLTAAVTVASDPVALSGSPGRVDVFFRGADGALYTATALASTTAYPKVGAITPVMPTPAVSAVLAGTPSVVAPAAGRLDVLARDTSGVLHHLVGSGSGWTHEIVVCPTLWGDPVAVSCSPQRIDVFARTGTNRLTQLTMDGSNWRPPSDRGEAMGASSLLATSGGTGRIDLLAQGSDDVLWHLWFDGSVWHGWAPIGDTVSTPPAAVSANLGQLDVFVGRTDGALWHRTRLPDEAWAALETSGLQGVVTTVNGLVNRVNDALDLGFARAQAAMYRLRQQVLSTTVASRLATSPVLADIAQGESASATKEDVAAYVATWSTQQKAVPMVVSSAPKLLAQELLVRTASPVAAAPPLIARPLPDAVNRIPILNVRNNTPAAFVMATSKVLAAADAVAKVAAKPVARPAPVSPVNQVQGQTAIPGALQTRTISIAERLKQPASVESWQFALSTKYDILTSLANLDIDVGGISVPGSATYTPTGGTFVMTRPMIDLASLRDPNIAATLLSDQVPPDSDESSFFAQAVEVIEHAITGLRGVEGRVTIYQSLAALVQGVLTQLNAVITSADARLKTIGDGIGQARQDVVTARAFFAEEATTLHATIARRLSVLAQYVPYLVFQRPRQADLFGQAPVRALAPDVTAEAIPAALSSNAAAPPELLALIELLRDSPIAWFVHVPRALLLVDRVDTLNRTIFAAQARALARPLYALPAMPSGLLAEGISRAFSAQAAVILAARQATAALDYPSFTSLSWRTAQIQAAPLVSIGDLIDAPHGRLDASRAAAAEVENIQKVATALYLQFGAVDPRIRLDWAQTYAQYDKAIDLSRLSSLSSWDQVPMLDRQTMQALVTWIFGRFNAQVPAAVTLANDLVRVALLLASYDPVGDILSGYVPQPTAVAVGGTVDVRVDPTRVRVGMHALIGGDASTAHAVVEDIGAGLARVRVLSATGARLQFAAATPIQFVDPARGTTLFRGA